MKSAIRSAEYRVVAGRADLRSAEGDLIVQVVTSYMDVLLGQSVVALNLGNVRVLEADLKARQARLRVKDLTRTDAAQSEARLSLADSQLSSARGNLARACEAYRQVIGSWPEDLKSPPPLPRLPTNADQAAIAALRDHPAMASSAAQSTAARYDVNLARANRMPSVSITAGSSYNDYLNTRAQAEGLPASENELFDQTHGQSQGGLTLTLPLYQGGGASAKVRQAQELRIAADQQKDNTERQVVANARAAYETFVAAADAIPANERAVAAERLALEGMRAESGVGQRTVIEVLNAEQEYLNAQVQLATAQHDRYVAGFTLLNAIGHAEPSYLELKDTPLYDPVLNYKQVSDRWSDWSDKKGTRQ